MLHFKQNIYVAWYNLLIVQKRTAVAANKGDIIMQYYQRLKDLRDDKEKTQNDIAILLGTTRQQYARWESGAWQMPIEHYKTLAKFYNVSIDYLSGLIDTPRKLL